jgi:CheY-like chemotaxis protein
MLAMDSREAFDILLDDGVTPHCVFVELKMPGIDGLDFLQKVKSNVVLRDVPVIVHSPVPVDDQVGELLDKGAHAVYSKPYNYFGVCNVLTLYFKDFSTSIN